jgi:hypothetical protein
VRVTVWMFGLRDLVGSGDFFFARPENMEKNEDIKFWIIKY